MIPAQQPRAERDRDIVDPAAAALMRVRRGAEARGEGRLHGAAAKANLRSFGAAMEAVTASPVRRRDAERDPRQLGGYSGAGASPRDPQGIGGVMDRLVSGRGWRTPVAVGSVMTLWPELVGAYVAEHCVPESFEDTVLRVRCSSTAQAANMRMLQSQVLTTIEKRLGPGIVTRLDIVGPAAPSWRKGRRSIRGRGPRDTYG
ncbi:MAG: DciA family protein [Micrococcales bacterium]|nr:DciA family protein [Micrococcales bacterium]